MYIKVNRRNRPDCIVMLCQDRATKKWGYINLSSNHLCVGYFDSIDDAFSDMKKHGDVVGYSVIEDPFAPHLTENAMPSHDLSMPDIVERFGKDSLLRLLWAGEVEEE